MLDDIRKKMEDWQEPAPDGLWERIEASGALPRGRRRVSVTWRVAAATAAAAACIAAAMFLFPSRLPHEAEQHSLTAEKSPAAVPLPTPGESSGDTPKSSTATSGLTAHNFQGKKNSASSDIRNGIDYIYDKNAVLNGHGQNKSEQETAVEEISPEKEIRVHEGGMDQTAGGMGTEGDTMLSGNGAKVLSAESEDTPAHGLFSIGLSASNSPGSSSHGQGYTSLSGYSAYPVLASATQHGLWMDPEANLRLFNHGSETSTDTRHRLPVRTGLTFRYQLPSGLGFETGVTYTWLSSTFQSGSEANHYTSTRQMHYIGVPLNILYTFWDSRLLSIYVSAGGLIEKCVGGSTETTYTLGGEKAGTPLREPSNDRPLQWSVNLTAGAQLNLTRNIGLYAEPGIAYWFDDGTDLETVYKVHPLNFYLRFGLRFSFGL